MTSLPRSRSGVVGIDDPDGSRAALAFTAEEARRRRAALRLPVPVAVVAVPTAGHGAG